MHQTSVEEVVALLAVSTVSVPSVGVQFSKSVRRLQLEFQPQPRQQRHHSITPLLLVFWGPFKWAST